MKRIIIAFAVLISIAASAQEKAPYTFTTIKNNGAGATEDQCATGTCWSFATISFLESEIIRKGHPAVDLSEMYNVRYTYPAKAESYVRFQGKQQFGPGGLSHDAIYVMANYGIVPESAYTGLQGDAKRHDHGGLDAILESMVKSVVDKSLYKEGNEWKKSINSVLDAELGVLPAEFTFEGKKYTPQTFRDAMGLNASEYVSLTSFSHHPFYTPFVLEVPDNWAKGSFYNLPIDELVQVADYALQNGYTIAWDADVSESTFSFKNGLALWPEKSVAKDEYFKKNIAEEKVTQANRQVAFDNQETTDDHLMHITGMAKDQNGNIFYFTKNSWGTNNVYGGYQYVSQAYFKMKTVSMVVHKDAIPKEIRIRLGIN